MKSKANCSMGTAGTVSTASALTPSIMEYPTATFDDN